MDSHLGGSWRIGCGLGGLQQLSKCEEVKEEACLFDIACPFSHPVTEDITCFLGEKKI